MFYEGEKFVIRTAEGNDAPLYECPNQMGFAGESGSYTLRTILGDEPKQPFRGRPEDSVNFHYVHITYLPEGAMVGEHVHESNEQFYLIIQGEAEITLCGQKFPAKPYTIAVIRPGGYHGIRNTGKGDVIYICCEVEPARKYPFEREDQT